MTIGKLLAIGIIIVVTTLLTIDGRQEIQSKENVSQAQLTDSELESIRKTSIERGNQRDVELLLVEIQRLKSELYEERERLRDLLYEHN